MSKDNLLDSLKEAAEQRAIGSDQLRAMLDDEMRVLSSGARVHDYIHVFAIRHLRERMRRQGVQGSISWVRKGVSRPVCKITWGRTWCYRRLRRISPEITWMVLSLSKAASRCRQRPAPSQRVQSQLCRRRPGNN